MRYDPAIHHRRSIRLRGYDYSSPGAYFMTICVQERACLFGQILGPELTANAAGRMVERWWRAIGQKFPNVQPDALVVMPNHFHGIVIVTGAVGEVQCDRPKSPADVDAGAHVGAPLPQVIQWFKTMTTNEYIRGVKEQGWDVFAGRLWQRGYYEHIVRGEGDLYRVRQYISDNPAKWALDPENPVSMQAPTTA